LIYLKITDIGGKVMTLQVKHLQNDFI